MTDETSTSDLVPEPPSPTVEPSRSVNGFYVRNPILDPRPETGISPIAPEDRRAIVAKVTGVEDPDEKWVAHAEFMMVTYRTLGNEDKGPVEKVWGVSFFRPLPPKND